MEDDAAIADILSDGLRYEGYAVDVVHDGGAALIAVGASNYDVLILDRDIPQIHGDTVAKMLRAQGVDVGILMLTAASTLNDKITGLDLGADAYLTKPFVYPELLAEIRALGRRSALNAQSTILSAGNLHLDTSRRVVSENGLPLRLTPKEYGLLEALIRAQGAWVSSEELLDEVWDEVGGSGERSRAVVRSAMHTLRKKLREPWLIDSATAFGYRIEVDSDD